MNIPSQVLDQPIPSPAAEPTTTSRFRLLPYFSVTSIVAVVCISVVLAFLYERTARQDLFALGESNNVALTQAFSNSVWPKFAAHLSNTETITTPSLREHDKTTALNGAVKALMRGTAVVKVKVYDINARTVFSTEAKQIGENKTDHPGFQAALSGVVASELTHRDTFGAFESVIVDRDVLASYIPIRRAGEIEGVFEVYSDVTELLDAIAKTTQELLLWLVVVLGILYLILVGVVRRADRILNTQHGELAQEVAARVRAEEQARQYAQTLEHRVQERTAALESARDAAEAANRAKSEFLANMSHELRTPLHGIMSFAELGTMEVDVASPEELLDIFSQIETSGATLRELLDELLDLAKLESGQYSITLRAVDTLDVINRVTNELAPLVRSRDLRLNVVPPSKPVIANADAGRLAQILRNMLHNAIQVSPSNSVIELRVSNAGGFAKIEVADAGPGVPPDELEAIFGKFTQSSLTKTGAGGTGLGLAICRELATAHGGHISARNHDPRGAIFKVEIPLANTEGDDR